MRDKSMNILLIEDDEVDIMNVERAFKRINLTNPLYIARDGVEALAMLRGQNGKAIVPWPRLILLDINMPRMNGIEFLHEIRQDPALKMITVIVLTTSNEERDVVAAYQFNVAGYIIKPVSFEEFVKTLGALDHYWTLSEMP
ncbi:MULTISPECIES: response regulator [Sporomusa]|uniref:Response regulator rcp1 n=1 Tax=Sporomusa sphaeroides DSM 2875 TaxID=1337886 RepID=A0ABP2C7X6_9FIRM|nr:response regulator [Sporomusa sphaeroides]OLS55058.1 response regulator rcp1 [Sporomusa sphaeroides DSM 2875]CVK19504.1 Response regulator rcp1 [Sporomusa sphaeroides DSM 2875]